MPDNLPAVQRVLHIKQRESDKGLILIAAMASQFEGWISLPDGQVLPDPDPEHPIAWIVPPGPQVSGLLRGIHANIAVRITTNATARELCLAVDSPLVSTSANLSGHETPTTAKGVAEQLGDSLPLLLLSLRPL